MPEQKPLTAQQGMMIARALICLSSGFEEGSPCGPFAAAARRIIYEFAYPEDALVGLPAPINDAQRHEADRVMVRAVSPNYPGPDDDRDTWVLDPGATGHRAPFAVGDFVVRSSGREGIHRVVEVWTDGDEGAPRHRSLRLKVAPTDVVVDRDAF